MKVLYINDDYFYSGGAANLMFDTLNLLNKNNVETIVFSQSDQNTLQSPYKKYFIPKPNWKFRSLNLIATRIRRLFPWSINRKLSQLIKVLKPDLVHIGNLHYHLSLGIIPLLKKFNLPVVFQVNDAYLFCARRYPFRDEQRVFCAKCSGHQYGNIFKNLCGGFEGGNYSPLNLVETFFNYWDKVKYWKTHKRIDAFIVTSRASQALLENALNIEKKKFHLIRHAFDFSKFPFSDQFEDFAVFYGYFSDAKGIWTIVEAWKVLKDKNISFPLRMFLSGSKNDLIALEEFIEMHQLSVSVDTKLTMKNGLKDIVSRAKFVVLATEWPSSTECVYYESMSLGRPILSADLPGGVELLPKENIVFKTGDAQSLAQGVENYIRLNIEELRKIGSNNRKAVQEISKESVIFELIKQVYDGAILRMSKQNP